MTKNEAIQRNLALATIVFTFWVTPLSAETQPPRPLDVVQPNYPIELLQNPVAGEALIQLTITESGAVEDVKIVEASLPEFGEAAIAAVRLWHFSPATKDGKPVALKTRIPIRFAAPDPEHLLVGYIERTAGYDVWTNAFEDYKVYTEDHLSKLPEPITTAPPPYPSRLQDSGETVTMRIQGLVSPDGKFHNPILLDEDHQEFLLHAILYLADRIYTPGRNQSNERVWAMRTFDVRFEPPPDSLRRDKLDAIENMQQEDNEAEIREQLKQFNSDRNARTGGPGS